MPDDSSNDQEATPAPPPPDFDPDPGLDGHFERGADRDGDKAVRRSEDSD